MRKRKDIPIETLVLGIIMAGNLIYLIPNSALSPIGWLMVGAIAGFVQFDVRTGRRDTYRTLTNILSHKSGIRYTRFDTGTPSQTPQPPLDHTTPLTAV